MSEYAFPFHVGADGSLSHAALHVWSGANYAVVMETPMEKTVKTTAQGLYSVVVVTPPVTAYAQKYDGSRQQIAVWKEAKAYQFVALTRNTVFVGGEIGHLSRTFNAASVDGNGGGEQNVAVVEGEPFVEPSEYVAQKCSVRLQHATWCAVPAGATSVEVTPEEGICAYSMQLLLTPAADLELVWLTSTDSSKPIYWPFGEPYLVGGYRYCITLVQLPDMIVANLTPLGVVPPVAV